MGGDLGGGGGYFCRGREGVESYARRNFTQGLNIHAGKSKILTSERVTIERVTLRNKPLEIVESFTYLGSIIDGEGGTEADVRTRIGKTRIAFANLSNLWKASKISISTKIRLFNSNVKLVLLYGCETWKTT